MESKKVKRASCSTLAATRSTYGSIVKHKRETLSRNQISHQVIVTKSQTGINFVSLLLCMAIKLKGRWQSFGLTISANAPSLVPCKKLGLREKRDLWLPKMGRNKASSIFGANSHIRTKGSGLWGWSRYGQPRRLSLRVEWERKPFLRPQVRTRARDSSIYSQRIAKAS